MSTSVEISLDTAKLPVVATGVSEQMGAIDMHASASSVLGEPKLAGDGSDTQIQSEPAATAAATAKVPAVGAAASEESAPLDWCLRAGLCIGHHLLCQLTPCHVVSCRQPTQGLVLADKQSLLALVPVYFCFRCCYSLEPAVPYKSNAWATQHAKDLQGETDSVIMFCQVAPCEAKPLYG